MLASERFVGESELREWLTWFATRHGPGNITVDWTPSLRADGRLAAAVRDCVGTS
jgi:hypothetical protein